ncbi:MAG: hypothetical protein LC808_01455 [Actinobacteria bacterium]|nr:hypothetical protein [Actinomycetota bacterium]
MAGRQPPSCNRLRHRSDGPRRPHPHRRGQGNAAADLQRWCEEQDEQWLAAITVVATDLAESYRAGLDPHLAHAARSVMARGR